MYYHCPDCGKKFKSELGLVAELGGRKKAVPYEQYLQMRAAVRAVR